MCANGVVRYDRVHRRQKEGTQDPLTRVATTIDSHHNVTPTAQAAEDSSSCFARHSGGVTRSGGITRTAVSTCRRTGRHLFLNAVL